MVSVPCSECSAKVHLGDDFCQSCGARISDGLKRALKERLEATDMGARERGRRVDQATQAIGWLAVLFVVGGAIMFFMARSTAEEALGNLRGMDPNDRFPVPVEGVTYTVGELRALIEREPYQVLGLNLLLAAIMAGLAFWSKRSPLPAVVTALAVFVAVHLLNAVADPKTIVQGIFIKIIATVVLAKGVKAAFDARRAELGAGC